MPTPYVTIRVHSCLWHLYLLMQRYYVFSDTYVLGSCYRRPPVRLLGLMNIGTRKSQLQVCCKGLSLNGSGATPQ